MVSHPLVLMFASASEPLAAIRSIWAAYPMRIAQALMVLLVAIALVTAGIMGMVGVWRDLRRAGIDRN
jgi:hypothetical protein